MDYIPVIKTLLQGATANTRRTDVSVVRGRSMPPDANHPLVPRPGNQNILSSVLHIEGFRYMDMELIDDHIVRIAKALADKTRLRILSEIAKGKSITCGEAAKIAGLSQPTVSHHLKVLFDAGLLITKKNGRHVNISVNKKALDDFSELIADAVKR